MALLSQIGRHHVRMLALARRTAFTGSRIAPKSTGTAQEQMDDFWNKNKELNRPMSPHLTIYNLQDITSAMSLTHRATGIYLAGVTVSFAFWSPFLSENLDQAILALQDSSAGFSYLCLMGLKFSILWPIVFHSLNGLRHLAWDSGKGFEMGVLKKSGYGIILISFIISALIMLCSQMKNKA